MTTSIVICDDSSMARKQLARALPENWNVEISFAANGYEGLKAINKTGAEIMFLDLNMPEMDGYEVLRTIREMDLPTLVIVVSGDIQPEAYQRVVKLGALDFIKKPVDPGIIENVLKKYGIPIERKTAVTQIVVPVNFNDGYQEVANIAMGRAADLLARLLDVFVILPVPNVSMLEASELRMALSQVSDHTDSISALCQGFIGPGIAGEALLIFNETSFADIAELMNFSGETNEAIQMELLMDVSNILIGACLKGIADQLDITFSQGHPVILGRHVKMQDLLQQEGRQWQKTLAIEIPYKIENKKIDCNLLLLFTEDSIRTLNDRISCIME
ncbi:MAG: hypothetical protein QG652_1753 [Pseudomonadota bacterium]|nr:hypothetical protein [Pseudomonadota bacterium]